MQKKVSAFELIKEILLGLATTLGRSWLVILGYLVIEVFLLYVCFAMSAKWQYAWVIYLVLSCTLLGQLHVALFFSAFNKAAGVSEIILTGVYKFFPFLLMVIIIVLPCLSYFALGLFLGRYFEWFQLSPGVLGFIAIGVCACIYYFLRLYCSFVILVNKNCGIIGSIKESWKISRGNVLQIFCIMLIGVLLYIGLEKVANFLFNQAIVLIPGSIVPFMLDVFWVSLVMLLLPFNSVIAVTIYKNISSEKLS